MMKFLKLTFVSVLVMTLSPLTFSAKAADLNLQDLLVQLTQLYLQDFLSVLKTWTACCKMVRRSHMPTGVTSRTGAASGFSDATYSLNTKWGLLSDAGKLNIKRQNKNGGGCATAQTDGYGNTSYNALPLGDVNSDNGSLNFRDAGDFIDATQKAFSEISATTDGGIGLNLSFIASYNPVLDLNGAQFFDLTDKAKNTLESDFTLLDAYITHSIDTGSDMGFVDITAGRFATSWGEATFIPIGITGLLLMHLTLQS